jgi:ABC-type Fe3+/spermidine/putrescine transport system ATPase subunit
MIEVRGLNLSLGNFRIENLNLTVKEKAFNILLGPTGAGKTLILESIAGLRRIHKGRVLVGEEEVQHLPPEKRGVSYVPQDLALFPHLTVERNLVFGLRTPPKSIFKDDPHLARLVDTLKIEHLLQRYPQGLSGGEKQRVALGRALAPCPRLLLLDEPLAALDPALKGEIQQLLLSLHRSIGFTALHVTHDLDEAYLLGERINVLIHGKLEQSGTKEDVFLRPQTAGVARFLGLRNLFRARVLRRDDGRKSITAGVWGREVMIPLEQCARNPFPGEEVFLYLRPEEVMILRPGKSVKESLRQNIFGGQVERVLDRGTHRWVLFRPLGLEVHLEINLPNYVFRNLELGEGNEIQVAMRRESFWVIPTK